MDAGASSKAGRLWTIPNLICIARFFGSFALLPLAYYGQTVAFVVVLCLLFLSDLIDGKLAIWLDQRSPLGARIDSVADAAYYGMAAVGSLWLKWNRLGEVIYWIAAAILSYALTSLFAYFKYGRLPAYHTLAAKASNWLVIGGAAIWRLWNQPWPLRIALAGVTLTNLETLSMTAILPEWKADIASIWHAQKLRNL